MASLIKSSRRTADGTAVTTTDGAEWLIMKIDGKRGFRLFTLTADKHPEITAEDERGFNWSDDFDTKKQALAWLDS